MMTRRAFLHIAALSAAGLAAAEVAAAQVSLQDIQRRLQAQFGGRMVDARRAGDDVYIIDWLSGDGRKLTIVVDARTGAVQSVRGG